MYIYIYTYMQLYMCICMYIYAYNINRYSSVSLYIFRCFRTNESNVQSRLLTISRKDFVFYVKQKAFVVSSCTNSSSRYACIYYYYYYCYYTSVTTTVIGYPSIENLFFELHHHRELFAKEKEIDMDNGIVNKSREG